MQYSFTILKEMQFTFLILCGFIGLEIFSYVVHRWVFHGILWKIHETHHIATKGSFEANDLFSIFFALISIGLIVFAEKPYLTSLSFPVGLGIVIYGVFYFILHDLFTHRRFIPFKSNNSLFLTIRAAHQRHHQTAKKRGIEPYGLFIFDFGKFRKKLIPTNPKSKIQNPKSV